MSSIETISAPCPHCQQPMMQKYDSSSSHSFMYDACFSCGYATGEANAKPLASKEVWETLLSHHGYTTITEMVNGLSLTTDSPDTAFHEPIYTPSDAPEDDVTDITATLISPEQFATHLKYKY